MPEVIVSDYGTQFTSAQFAEFCKSKGIQQRDFIFSLPYHSQPNGQAERFVDTFKHIMFKFRGEETAAEALQTFLLGYRTKPNTTLSNRSPAEALLGRRLHTSLELIHPTSPTPLRRDNVMEQQFSRAHGARNHSFVREDFVLGWDHRSPQPQWTTADTLQTWTRSLRRSGRLKRMEATHEPVATMRPGTRQQRRNRSLFQRTPRRLQCADPSGNRTFTFRHVSRRINSPAGAESQPTTNASIEIYETFKPTVPSPKTTHGRSLLHINIANRITHQ